MKKAPLPSLLRSLLHRLQFSHVVCDDDDDDDDDDDEKNKKKE